MTAGQSDGSVFPSKCSRFKELLERIVSCSSSDREVETKQLSCYTILGGTGVTKTMLVTTWLFSTKPEKTVGSER